VNFVFFGCKKFDGCFDSGCVAQKDLDAEWAKKGNDTFYGYKNHAMSDDEFKFIRGYGVTGAASHDSEPYPDVMPEKPAFDDQEAYADSAYSGKKIETKLKERGYKPMICEKGYRNHPLTEEQKASNREKSRVRCRIEHIFGSQKMRMGNEILRSIGFARARFWIGMRNLMYNMSRLVSLKRPKKNGRHPNESWERRKKRSKSPALAK
jgi:IS5 family transposase